MEKSLVMPLLPNAQMKTSSLLTLPKNCLSCMSCKQLGCLKLAFIPPDSKKERKKKMAGLIPERPELDAWLMQKGLRMEAWDRLVESPPPSFSSHPPAVEMAWFDIGFSPFCNIFDTVVSLRSSTLQFLSVLERFAFRFWKILMFLF